jgi:DNA-directed RNA polymerase subunit RPC12/RpoP
VGGVRVRVPASYAERASTIVSAIEAGDYEIEDTDEPTLQCPACGSTHVNEHKKGWKIAFLVFYLLHIPMPYRRNEFRCSDCGKIFSMTTE